MASLRAILVGCGRIGAFTDPALRASLPPHLLPYSHIESMLACPEISVVGACDVNRDRLSAVTERYKISDTWTEIEPALRSCAPDIAAIATRTDVRARALEACIAHGVKGMYVEKPFLNSLVESERALGEITARGIKLAYGTSRRYNAGFRECGRLIRSGRLGKLTAIATTFPDGLMMWAFPHMVDIALCALDAGDSIVEAQATAANAPQSQIGVVADDILFSSGAMRSANGVECLFTLAPDRSVTFRCSNGSIVCTGEGRQLRVETEGRSETIAPVYTMSPTQRGFHELAQAVIAGAPGPIGAADILHGLEALWMLGQSALTGRPVSRHDIDRDLVFKALYKGMPA